MNNAITIGDVVFVGIIIVGFIGVLAGVFFLLDLLNPFRSGH